MPSLTLKAIPEELLERLRDRAREERRSLTQQVLVLIERGLERESRQRSEKFPEQVSEQVEAWRRLAGGWVSDESAEAEIKTIYDARTAGRDVEL